MMSIGRDKMTSESKILFARRVLDSFARYTKLKIIVAIMEIADKTDIKMQSKRKGFSEAVANGELVIDKDEITPSTSAPPNIPYANAKIMGINFFIYSSPSGIV